MLLIRIGNGFKSTSICPLNMQVDSAWCFHVCNVNPVKVCTLWALSTVYRKTVFDKLTLTVSYDARCYYFVRDRGEQYCDDRVCLSVCCLPVYLSIRICQTRRPAKRRQIFCIFVAGGRGSIIFWHLCDTLCISGFVDDVILLQNGPYDT